MSGDQLAGTVTVVIPTIGRESLGTLLSALSGAPMSVIVVDDRPRSPTALPVDSGVRVLRSGGRGPATARNVGWRAAATPWVAFLDDDVIPEPGWADDLARDLRRADDVAAAGSQGAIVVPRIHGLRPADDEHRTLRLAGAQWISADMAYRRTVLVQTGGFDERFPRAFREDSDLALRIVQAGHRILDGQRRSTHPVAPAGWWSSVRAQVGNRDNALMRRKFGRHWRTLAGERRGRMPAHVATTATGVVTVAAALSGRSARAKWAAALWMSLTAEFAARRFWAGARTAGELLRMVTTSVPLPPAAVVHRLVGEWTFRAARREPPLAVLLDRDDTLIADGPYLCEPERVRPLPGAHHALGRLRDRGLKIAVVTNQSGVAKGLITAEQLAAVNTRVERMLGPFDNWQICVHDENDGCACRKPLPGMVIAAAEELGVDPSRCVMIGDTGGDVNAALSARARAVLVPTSRTLAREVADARRRAKVAVSLDDAVSLVLRECR